MYVHIYIYVLHAVVSSGRWVGFKVHFIGLMVREPKRSPPKIVTPKEGEQCLDSSMSDLAKMRRREQCNQAIARFGPEA